MSHVCGAAMRPSNKGLNQLVAALPLVSPSVGLSGAGLSSGCVS